MKHGTFLEIDGRPALRFERRLGHPTEKVWRAVTSPDGLAAWFPARVEGDFTAGGALRFVFANGEGPPGSGEVLEVDEPRRFAFTWDGDRMTIDLEPAGDGCLLTFTHVFEDRTAAARDAAGWHVCLDLLERSLGGEPTTGPSGVPDAPWKGLYEEYSERGLPTGAPVPD